VEDGFVLVPSAGCPRRFERPTIPREVYEEAAPESKSSRRPRKRRRTKKEAAATLAWREEKHKDEEFVKQREARRDTRKLKKDFAKARLVAATMNSAASLPHVSTAWRGLGLSIEEHGLVRASLQSGKLQREVLVRFKRLPYEDDQ
jgi:hypothetical protein